MSRVFLLTKTVRVLSFSGIVLDVCGNVYIPRAVDVKSRSRVLLERTVDPGAGGISVWTFRLGKEFELIGQVVKPEIADLWHSVGESAVRSIDCAEFWSAWGASKIGSLA